MNKHNYLMALAMNADVGTLHLSNADIPVKIVEVESENSAYSSPMTTFKCLVVNDDQIEYPDRAHAYAKERLNRIYGAAMTQPNYLEKGSICGAPNPGKTDPMKIDRVIFNAPATIVLWADGTKTVVKCQEGDVYSKETGLALCIAKKALGNKGNFNDVFKEWIPKSESTED